MVAASKAMSDFARAAIFYLIGNSYQIKNPPGRIALRRIGSMSQKRPAAGGESCEQDSFLKPYFPTLSGNGFS